jgi:hypothetical protein
MPSAPCGKPVSSFRRYLESRGNQRWEGNWRVKEYEIYVPLRYNDGSPIEARKIANVGERLLGYFHGVTFFPQPNLGRLLKRLKEELKKELKQEEILIVEKDAEIL